MDKINLLFSKKQCLTEFYDLVIKEKECLVNEEWKKVGNIIRSKQLKIVKIDRIKEKLKKLTHDDNHQEKKIAEEIVKTIKMIKELEEENIEIIKEKMKQSKKEFKDIRIKQKVNTTYSNVDTIQKDGCFIDKLK